MSNNLVAILYLVSAILFIFALRGLSHPESSRKGNIFGIAGMLIAIITTLMFKSVLSYTEIGAAFGMAQLKKLEHNIKTRQENFIKQCNFFDKYSEYFSNPEETYGINTAWLAFPILIKTDAPFTRKEFQIYLERNNIQTRPIFSGNILRHPAFSSLISKKNKLNEFEGADYIMRNGLLIGCHQGLSKKDIFYIQSVILNFINSKETVKK